MQRHWRLQARTNVRAQGLPCPALPSHREDWTSKGRVLRTARPYRWARPARAAQGWRTYRSLRRLERHRVLVSEPRVAGATFAGELYRRRTPQPLHAGLALTSPRVSLPAGLPAVRRRSARKGSTADCGLSQPSASGAAADGNGCVAAASRGCAALQQVALRCNGLRCDATGNAAIQKVAQCCGDSSTPGCVRACVRTGPTYNRP